MKNTPIMICEEPASEKYPTTATISTTSDTTTTTTSSPTPTTATTTATAIPTIAPTTTTTTPTMPQEQRHSSQDFLLNNNLAHETTTPPSSPTTNMLKMTQMLNKYDFPDELDGYTSDEKDDSRSSPTPENNKKQRRKEKNKEAAKLFRVRQRSRLEELAHQLQELKAVNVDYCCQLQLLTNENKLLREQLGFWRSVVSGGILIPPEQAFAFTQYLTSKTIIQPQMPR